MILLIDENAHVSQPITPKCAGRLLDAKCQLLLPRRILLLMKRPVVSIAFLDAAPPVLVVPIPCHGVCEALVEADLRLPTHLTKFGSIERVAAVVSWPVHHLLDQ